MKSSDAVWHYSIIGFGLGQDSGIQAFGNKLIPVSHKTRLYIDVLHMLFLKAHGVYMSN